MEMLRKRGRLEGWKNVKVTGIDGDVMTFDTIQAAADFLEVRKQTLYLSLKFGYRVRGCKIEAERK